MAIPPRFNDFARACQAQDIRITGFVEPNQITVPLAQGDAADDVAHACNYRVVAYDANLTTSNAILVLEKIR